jgi:hypothetical protein
MISLTLTLAIVATVAVILSGSSRWSERDE